MKAAILCGGVLAGACAFVLYYCLATVAHDLYGPAAILYPYALVLARLEVGDTAIPIYGLALLQYPAYAAVLAFFPHAKRSALVLAAAHVVTGFLASR